MQTGERWRLGHRPGLDGLRGVAILLVLIAHILGGTQSWIGLGSAGVTVFFTLSGFLITALLAEERTTSGRVSLTRFYRRRAARLLPAMFVMVLAIAWLQALAGIGSWSIVVPIFAYVGNLAMAGGANLWFIGHTWSLAVEEQFYLLWPVALIIAWRWRNGPVIVAAVGIVASVVSRAALWLDGASWERIYFGTDARFDGLLVGCMLALAIHRGSRFRIPMPALAAAITLAGVSMSVSYGPFVHTAVIPTVVPWLTAAAIVVVLDSPGWLATPGLRYLGRRSYGLYLWHFPLLIGGEWVGVPVWTTLPLAFALTEASWWCVERPFLRARQVAARRTAAMYEPASLVLAMRPDAALP